MYFTSILAKKYEGRLLVVFNSRFIFFLTSHVTPMPSHPKPLICFLAWREAAFKFVIFNGFQPSSKSAALEPDLLELALDPLF